MDYELEGESRRIVLDGVRLGSFGHKHMADRAQANILFRADADFTVLDRSRGEWGEPADDVTCFALNYLFFSLQRSGKLEDDFERLWERYLERSGDHGMLEVAAPFLAFHGLVMANPVCYPALDKRLRHKMLSFVRNVLEDTRFDPARANAYCEA